MIDIHKIMFLSIRDLTMKQKRKTKNKNSMQKTSYIMIKYFNLVLIYKLVNLVFIPKIRSLSNLKDKRTRLKDMDR